MRVEILTGDAFELIRDIPPRSVDLIFTDPLYLSQGLHLYAWLAEQAARVLRPEGWLLFFATGYPRPAGMEALGRRLVCLRDFRIPWSRYKSLLACHLPEARPKPRRDELSGPDLPYPLWG